MYEDAKKDRNVFASEKGRAGKFPRLILKKTTIAIKLHSD